jgi:hypothetical protein
LRHIRSSDIWQTAGINKPVFLLTTTKKHTTEKGANTKSTQIVTVKKLPPIKMTVTRYKKKPT